MQPSHLRTGKLQCDTFVLRFSYSHTYKKRFAKGGKNNTYLNNQKPGWCFQLCLVTTDKHFQKQIKYRLLPSTNIRCILPRKLYRLACILSFYSYNHMHCQGLSLIVRETQKQTCTLNQVNLLAGNSRATWRIWCCRIGGTSSCTPLSLTMPGLKQNMNVNLSQ